MMLLHGAFARAVSSHEFLNDLNVAHCGLRDNGIRIFADELVGNTIMEVFNISHSQLSSSNALDDITRLIQSTRIKSFNMSENVLVFGDEAATQRFVARLRYKQSSVQELPGIVEHSFPEESRVATYASIKNSLLRNQQLNHVDSLLAQPLPAQHDAALMMFKTWHKAITKLALVPDDAGASAIFKLFTARPQLLEKRISQESNDSTNAISFVGAVDGQKRPRLYKFLT
jgi:hypothetical protein